MQFKNKIIESFPDKPDIEKSKATKCHYDGKEYNDGQEIHPNDEVICYCGEGFDNSTLINNTHCEKPKKKLDCNIPLHYFAKVRDGCIPVYYKSATGCPIEWICRKLTPWGLSLSNNRIYSIFPSNGSQRYGSERGGGSTENRRWNPIGLHIRQIEFWPEPEAKTAKIVCHLRLLDTAHGSLHTRWQLLKLKRVCICWQINAEFDHL